MKRTAFVLQFAVLLSLVCTPLTALAQEVELAWDPYPGVRFNLYRADSPEGLDAAVPLNASGLTAPGFIDTLVERGRTYFYAVTAVGGTPETESPFSNIVSAVGQVTLPPAPTMLTSQCSVDGKTATLTWSNAPEASSSYLRVQDAASTSAWLAYQDRFAAEIWTGAVPEGKPVVWWVHGANSAGIGDAAFGKFTCTPPTVPPPVDACIAKPLTVTVSSWPTSGDKATQFRYDPSEALGGPTPIAFVSLTTVTFTDKRGCQATVKK